MSTKINANRRIQAGSVGKDLLDSTLIDGGGKFLTSLLPSSLLSGLKNPVTWDASTGMPAGAQEGDVFRVTVAGTVSSVDYEVGDLAIYTGGSLVKIDNTEKVTSVNSKTGAVVLNTDDVAQGTTNKYYSASLAKADVVVNSTSATATDQAMSAGATQDLVSGVKSGLKGAVAMTGTIDGSNKVFTVAGQYLQASISVFVGRVPLAPSEWSYGYASNTTTITIGGSVDAPVTGEDVLIIGSLA